MRTLALFCFLMIPSLASAQFVGGRIGDDLGTPEERPNPEEIRLDREVCLLDAYGRHRRCIAQVCFALRDAVEPEVCMKGCDKLLLSATEVCFANFPPVICE